MVVDGSVVTYASVPPEGLHAHGNKKYVGVVDLVVVRHPGSNESPESFDSRVSSDSCDFLWLPL